ncbi:MAG: hypothetical protein WCD49_04320 [Candidatus Acidiferrales bacterium]
MPRQIIEPEPHSTGHHGMGWNYVPRWLQFVLVIIAVAAMALLAFFVR